MTVYAPPSFKGLLPSITDSQLPPGYASIAVNTKLTGGSIKGFFDVGNPFQLAKPAPIIALAKAQNNDWLQFTQTDLASFAPIISVTPGLIPGDTTGRRYITGFNGAFSGAPQFTNNYFATDPSQQGSNTLNAFPYVTHLLGIADPTTAPTSTVPAIAGQTTAYEFAQEEQVENALLNVPGAGYTDGDILTIQGGVLSTGLPAATIQVSTTTSSGGVATFTILTGGFYTNGNPPPATGAAVTGGTGSGATFNTTSTTNSFTGFTPLNHNNMAGAYATWSITSDVWQVSAGQGDLTVASSNEAFGLEEADSYTVLAQLSANNNGTGVYADTILWLSGAPTGNINGNVFTGSAVVLSEQDSSFKLYQHISGSNGAAVTGPVVATTPFTVTAGTRYQISVALTQQTASSTAGFSAVVTLSTKAAPGTALATLTGFVPYMGESVAVGSNNRDSASGNANGAQFENIYVTVTEEPSSVTVESTNYLYTYVQQWSPDPLTQESGPSDPGPTIDVYINSTTDPATRTPVTITIPAAPAGEGIAFYNVYRLVEDSQGNETYTFVVQLAASTTATTTYVDSAQDSAIGPAILISQDWAPPPANLVGIVAGPNGVMFGWTAQSNIFCCSAPNYPHAWPVENQYATDTNITSVTPTQTSVLLTTQGVPYTAWGTDPSAFSMGKEVTTQGCVSTAGVVTHKVFGPVYPSGNGYSYYRGQGQLDLVRVSPLVKPPFDYDQWQALVPSSINAVIHDDVLFFSYTTGSVKGTYVLDLEPNGFGMITLDFHVSCWYIDKSTDTLYLVPDYSVYPINGAAVATAQNVVSQWEAATTYRTRQWGRNDILSGRPAGFAKARVQSNNLGSGSITLLAGSETGTAFNGAVGQQRSFTIGSTPGFDWNALLTITGPTEVKTFMLVEDAEELSAA